MNLNNLKPAKGARKTSKRLGRGQGSTMGGTATRGHKGAGSRAGNKIKQGFEGGQMPLQRRMPKFGFKNPFRNEYKGINLSQFQAWVDKGYGNEYTVENLRQYDVIGKTQLVKVLGTGELKAALKLKVHAISAKAKETVEARGGSVEIVKP